MGTRYESRPSLIPSVGWCGIAHVIDRRLSQTCCIFPHPVLIAWSRLHGFAIIVAMLQPVALAAALSETYVSASLPDHFDWANKMLTT